MSECVVGDGVDLINLTDRFENAVTSL